MVREVCEDYTGTKKEYRKSGCTKCDSYSFFDGGEYERDSHTCNGKELFMVEVIPFRDEEWRKEHQK